MKLDPNTTLVGNPVLQATLNYLAQRPFIEVHEIIGALQGAHTAHQEAISAAARAKAEKKVSKK